MGLLLRLFGKDAGYTIPADDAARDFANVRAQHYLFAHRGLPSMAHARPQQVMMSLLGDHERFLAGVWAVAGEQAEAQGQRADRSFRPRVAVRRLHEQTAWHVIPMPQPRTATEAFFVALGLRTRGGGWDARAYTLELGDGHAVLGEWTADGRHRNFGPVSIRLEPQAFLDLCLSDAVRSDRAVGASG